MEKVRKLLFGDHDPYQNFTPIEKSLLFQGWDSCNPIFEEVIREAQPKLIIEVGTWVGGSAVHMANLCKEIYGNNDFEIVCIDTFCGSYEHWNRTASAMAFVNGRPSIYEAFISNVIRANHQDVITPFPVDSRNANIFLKEAKIEPDLVYIDAGHDEISVQLDLIHFAAILKKDGRLIGDDYNSPTVKAAADYVFQDKIIDRGMKYLWIK